MPVIPAVTEAQREARARRALKRDGLVVRKDRARQWSLNHQGGYMVIDADRNFVVRGSDFDLTLDGLEELAQRQEGSTA